MPTVSPGPKREIEALKHSMALARIAKANIARFENRLRGHAISLMSCGCCRAYQSGFELNQARRDDRNEGDFTQPSLKALTRLGEIRPAAGSREFKLHSFRRDCGEANA